MNENRYKCLDTSFHVEGFVKRSFRQILKGPIVHHGLMPRKHFNLLTLSKFSFQLLTITKKIHFNV
jgi:hypothetical protein